jgi:hypothetical protein
MRVIAFACLTAVILIFTNSAVISKSLGWLTVSKDCKLLFLLLFVVLGRVVS